MKYYNFARLWEVYSLNMFEPCMFFFKRRIRHVFVSLSCFFRFYSYIFFFWDLWGTYDFLKHMFSIVFPAFFLLGNVLLTSPVRKSNVRHVSNERKLCFESKASRYWDGGETKSVGSTKWQVWGEQCKKHHGCLGDLLGMTYYPVIWGLFHKPL